MAKSLLPVAIDPRGMSWERWATTLTEALARHNLPIPGGEGSWSAWAFLLFASPDLVGAGVLDPRGFTDWRRWAEATVQVLNT